MHRCRAASEGVVVVPLEDFAELLVQGRARQRHDVSQLDADPQELCVVHGHRRLQEVVERLGRKLLLDERSRAYFRTVAELLPIIKPLVPPPGTVNVKSAMVSFVIGPSGVPS